MTRTQYITRTLAALCGERPARPDEYHAVAAMADRLESGAPDALRQHALRLRNIEKEIEL